MFFISSLSIRGWNLIINDLYHTIIRKIYGPKPIAAFVYIYEGNLEILTQNCKDYNKIPKVYLPYTTFDGKIIETGKLIANPIMYKNMSHNNPSNKYYVKLTSNIPNDLDYDSFNNPFYWGCNQNKFFLNKTKKKFNEISDDGILTIKFYSDKECRQCFHEGWKINIKELKKII